MITSNDFPKLIYRKPRLNIKRTRISNVLGLDTEAYTNGKPFLICLSDGTEINPAHAIESLALNYTRHNFLIYNMKYDSGALLYCLPRPVLYLLWQTGEVKWKEYKISYIKHKYLEISVTRNKVTEKVYFWDVAQYYKMSLDKAAQTYLGMKKKDMETKHFTPDFVRKNRDRIKAYCVHDAELTRLLGEHLFDKLESFKIVPSKIYSSASIAFQYYTTHCRYVTVWRLYQHRKEALKYACDAYRGGKFEISARGTFDGHIYDITSAYPYFVSNLVNISAARVMYSKDYQPEAVYGFVRVGFRSSGKPYPCGIHCGKSKAMAYPSGTIYTTITKVEYDWMVEHGFDITLYGGWWFFVRQKRYPYREVTNYLFSIKDDYKNKDKTIYNVIKVILNGIYGKKAQVIAKHDGTFAAGAGWNPVYAAYITAQTRIMVTEVQYTLGRRCIAVHTDSVTLTKRHDNLIREGLGGYEYVTGGRSVMIACGVYQVGDYCRYKGIKKPADDDEVRIQEPWFAILEKMGDKSTLSYRHTKAESWYEAMAKGHTKDRINVFYDDVKEINLNADIKRAWKSRTNAIRLLSGLEYAPPIHVVQNKPENFA